MDRGLFILIIMIASTIYGFVGVFWTVQGIAESDNILFIIGTASWFGFAVPMLLGESKRVDNWCYPCVTDEVNG